MNELRHKDCGGEIVISRGDVGQPEEGVCLKCGEKIIHPIQVWKPTEVEEKEEAKK